MLAVDVHADDPDVTLALAAYVQGLFPMDDPEAQDEPLPFYRADPRAVFELGDGALPLSFRVGTERAGLVPPGYDRQHRGGGCGIGQQRLERLGRRRGHRH